MYNSYTFHIASDYKPESSSIHEGLGSLGEITQKVRSEIMHELEFDRAKKLAAKYRKERDELQERVDELEAELDKIPLANLLGVQGGAALSGYLKSNPAIVARMPSGLAGLLGIDDSEQPEQIEAPQETTATFQPKQATEQPKEHDFIVFLKSRFDLVEQNKIIEMVKHFAQDKNALQTVFDLLQNPKQTPQQ